MKEKKQNSISQLLNYAGGHKKLTILGCIFSGIAAVLSMAPYICIWFVIRNIFDASSSKALINYGWIALILAVLSLLIYFAALMCTHLAAFRTAKNMRFQAAEHLISLPLGYFSANTSGRLRKLIDNNADMTETLLAHQLPDLTGAIVTPIAAIVLLFVFDWRMGLICFIPMIIGVYLLTSMMGGKNARFFSRYQKAIEELSTEATEYVRGIPVVKVFQQTVYSFKTFYASILKYKDLATDYAMSCRNPMSGFTTVLNGTFLFLIPVGMLLCASSSNGLAVLVDFIFYILFTPMCAIMMTRIMYASEAIMEADEAINKLKEIMGNSPFAETPDGSLPKNADVEFQNVTFTYPSAQQPALKNISFKAKEKTTIAFVGPSGSGKSTAASLIPRFWDAQEGKILIGGADITHLSSQELMNQISFVFQDTHLFKTSLFENIRAARPNAARQEVLTAAYAAQCKDILEKLPQGLDTVVGTKGVYLSGGECQRIALARAILKDAPIVILDEATAFADPENEALIQKAFENLTKGKTVIMIAHRLTTIQNAAQIFVFEKGQIIEQGTHQELVNKNGLYAHMWADYQTAAKWKVKKNETE